MKVEKITQKQYLKNQTSTKVSFTNNNLNERLFGRLEIEKNTILISWGSNFVDPEIHKDGKYLVLGVDLAFMVYSLDYKEIVMVYPLHSYFFKLIKGNNKLYIISESQIIILSSDNMNIIEEIGLPDVIEDYNILKSSFQITLMDGTKHNFDI